MSSTPRESQIKTILRALAEADAAITTAEKRGGNKEMAAAHRAAAVAQRAMKNATGEELAAVRARRGR
ncbi:hypothetical protein [Amycolatopsis sp. NPDC050768]|uniref:hypothetical protein n=1 Tax=Amycolatopsis sp. NPDC050768 TaxID=3154839 RepID=UPI0033ED314F